MDEKLAKLVVIVINDVFGKDAELFAEYIGGSLFGDITAGVSVDDPGYVFAAVGYVMALDDADKLVEFFSHRFGALENISYFDIGRLRVDNLGKKFIVY